MLNLLDLYCVHQFAFVSPLGKGRLAHNLHFYDLHTSSYNMINFI